MTAAAVDPESACQAAWIASVMWSAGALIDQIAPCGGPAEVRVVMRLSELGYAAVFDVRVCHDHHETLRRSPYHVGPEGGHGPVSDSTCPTPK